MADLIEETCRNADTESRKRYRKELQTRARGQRRYFDLENDFSALGSNFPELTVQLELHIGGGATFAVIERPDLRLTLARLLNYNDNPFARPFRRGKLTQEASRRFQSGQTSFLPDDPPNEKRLIAAICFGFEDPRNAIVPSFIEARFADMNYQCMNTYVDLHALQIEARRVPIEEVPDARETTTRIPAEEVPEERRTSKRVSNPARKIIAKGTDESY